MSTLFLLLELWNVLRGIGKLYVKSLDSRSDLPLTLPYGSNWGHKIADLCFCLISTLFLLSRGLQCMKRYWETLCEESR